jgi:hypothetical protein
MGLPTLVKVGPFGISVGYCRRGDLIRNGHGGAFDAIDMAIEIDPMLCGQKQWEVLIHEIVHAIAESMGMEMNEQDTVTLGTMLYAVLKENKDALKELE